MPKGLFITFEGPDGCGKSTQIKRFAEYLKNKGEEVVLSREPGGTQISEKIRQLILDPENKEEDAVTEMLLYAAARAQHVAQLIKPSVAEGKIVLCDRFVDSSIAYQAYGRKLGEQVEIVNSFAVAGCMPDITFFLNISAKEGRKRNEKTEKKDRLEQEALEFHDRVYDGYIELTKKYKDRMIVIDASKSIDEVFDEIVKAYEEYKNK